MGTNERFRESIDRLLTLAGKLATNDDETEPHALEEPILELAELCGIELSDVELRKLALGSPEEIAALEAEAAELQAWAKSETARARRAER